MLAHSIRKIIAAFAKSTDTLNTALIATSIKKSSRYLTKQRKSIANSHFSSVPSHPKSLSPHSPSTMYHYHHTGIPSQGGLQAHRYRSLSILLQARIQPREL